jgi:hypothetical protein
MSNRFAKIDDQGRALPADAVAHVAVYDATSGLMWTATDVGDGELSHADAEKACAALNVGGFTDWRLPAVEELFALADRSRQSPAIDVEFFPTCKSDWYWSSTPAAWSPSSAAWYVGFGDGYSGYDRRGSEMFVRAVRSVSAAPAAGQ